MTSVNKFLVLLCSAIAVFTLTSASVFAEGIDYEGISSPQIQSGLLSDIRAGNTVTVTTERGDTVSLTNSTDWNVFAQQLYVVGGYHEFQVTNSDGQSQSINSLDMQALGVLAKTSGAARQFDKGGVGVTYDRVAEWTNGVGAGAQQDITVGRSTYFDQTLTGGSDLPTIGPIEHQQTFRQRAATILESPGRGELSDNQVTEWSNSLFGAELATNGSSLGNSDSYFQLVASLQSEDDARIEASLDRVIAEVNAFSPYAMSFGDDSAFIAEELYVRPVILSAAIDDAIGDNPDSTGAVLMALEDALSQRFQDDMGLTAAASREMAIGYISSLPGMDTGSEVAGGALKGMPATPETIHSLIADVASMSTAAASNLYDQLSPETQAALLNALELQDEAALSNAITEALRSAGLNAEQIEQITSTLPTFLSTNTTDADTTGAQLMGAPIGDRVSTATSGFAESMRTWASFDLNPTPEWGDIMVQTLYRAIGQPVAYVHNQLLQGDAPASIANSDLVTPSIIIFQFGGAIGAIILSVLLLWSVMQGIYLSAKTGQFMGEKMSSFMHPFRTTIGYMFMVPLPMAGGMTVASVLMLSLILVSVGIAGSLAYAYSSAALQEPVIIFDRTVDTSMPSSALKGFVCMQTLNSESFDALIDGERKGDSGAGKVAYNGYPWVSIRSLDTNQTSYAERLENTDQKVPFYRRFWPFNRNSAWTDPLDSQSGKQAYVDDMIQTYGSKMGDPGLVLERIHFGEGGRCGEVIMPSGHVNGQANVTMESMERLEAALRGRTPNYQVLIDRLMAEGRLDGRTVESLKENDQFKAVIVLDEGSGDSVPALFSMQVAEQETEYARLHAEWKDNVKHAVYESYFDLYRQFFFEGVDGQGEPYPLNYFDIACVIVHKSECIEQGEYDPDGPKAQLLKGVSSEFIRSLGQQISEDFWVAVDGAVVSAFRTNEDASNAGFLESLRSMGFMGIGMIHWMIELRQDQYAEFYNFENLHAFNGVNYSQRFRFFGEERRRAIDFGNDTLTNLMNDNLNLAEFTAGDPMTTEIAETLESMAIDNSLSEGGKNFSQFLASAIGGTMLRVIADIDNTNAAPMTRIRTTGDAMQSLAGSVRLVNAIVAATGVGFRDGAVGTVGRLMPYNKAAGIVRFIEEIAKPYLALFNSFAFIGFLLSNIVPLLPAILFLISAIGLIAYYFEALFAINIGVAFKAHPDGDDLAGRSAKMYSLVMVTILRAPLMVIGFMIGVMLHWVGFHLSSGLIIPASLMANSTAEGWNFVNTTGFAGLLVAWAAVQIVLAYKCYSQVAEFPNAALRWIGVQDHQDLGEKDGSQRTSAFVHMAGGYMQGGAPGAAKASAKSARGGGNPEGGKPGGEPGGKGKE